MLQVSRKDWFALLTVIGFFTYAGLQAFYEDHWSFWVSGEAQILMAARHFVTEGFITHKFLPMVTPGFLIDLIPNNQPDGHYTHYPSLHAIITALFLKLAPVHGITLNRLFVLLLVSFSYLYWYNFLRSVFSRTAASLALLVTVWGAVPFAFADSLCNQGYDIAFRLVVIVLYHSFCFTTDPKRRHRLLYTLHFLLFVGFLNTVEPLFLFACFFALYGAFAPSPFSVKRGVYHSLILMIGPALAFLLHFAQTVWNWHGSISLALQDWGHISSAQARWIAPAALSLVLENLRHQFLQCAVVLVVVLFTLHLRRGEAAIHISPRWRFHLTLFFSLLVSASLFELLLSHQSTAMRDYISLQYYPAMGVGIAVLVLLIEAYLQEFNSRVNAVVIGILGFLCAGCLWAQNGAYFLGYPHLFNGTGWNVPEGFDHQAYLIGKQVAADLHAHTAYGDNVIVPARGFSWGHLAGNPLMEWWSDRRMFGETGNTAGLRLVLQDFENYKSRLSLDPRLKGTHLFAVAIEGYTTPEIREFFKSNWRMVEQQTYLQKRVEYYFRP